MCQRISSTHNQLTRTKNCTVLSFYHSQKSIALISLKEKIIVAIVNNSAR